MNYKISVKVNDKWKTIGRVKANQWGKLQCSFKNTDEFKALVNNGGEWLNFAMFEDVEKPKPNQQPSYDDLPF